MPDREKVIGHLNDCMEASRRDNTWVFVRKDIVEDALSILKKQKVQKFFLDESGKITPLPVVVRCKDCKKKGDAYLCRLDSDLLEHGGHRTDEYDNWFCADGERRIDDA